MQLTNYLQGFPSLAVHTISGPLLGLWMCVAGNVGPRGRQQLGEKISLSFAPGPGRKVLPSNSFSSLHFTSQGKSPQVVDPRLGAPFPDLAVEEALGQWKGLLSTVGLSGGVRPSLNPRPRTLTRVPASSPRPLRQGRIPPARTYGM